jgi:hypothetical protein
MILVTKLLAFIWLVLVGINVAGYYASKEDIYLQGPLIAVGAAYLLIAFHKEFLRLLLFKDFLLLATARSRLSYIRLIGGLFRF